MRKISERDRQTKKISCLAILTNSVQIACAVAILLYAAFNRSLQLPHAAEFALIAVTSGMLIWGGVVDMRDAMIVRRIEEQNRMLEEAYGQLEELNATLRKQRHDFKNHLQVVYTLTEMQSYGDAMDYVQRIYADVQSVGNLMRTAVPAVNALLSAKSADCAERDIRFEADIRSGWAEIDVTGWELCRILGNLVDNAMDALTEAHTPAPYITVHILENISEWTLIVENNGPEIAHEHKKSILLPGFTTKAEGHGNGLSIVRELVHTYSGRFFFESTPARTAFTCVFPRRAVHAQSAS